MRFAQLFGLKNHVTVSVIVFPDVSDEYIAFIVCR